MLYPSQPFSASAHWGASIPQTTSRVARGFVEHYRKLFDSANTGALAKIAIGGKRLLDELESQTKKLARLKKDLSGYDVKIASKTVEINGLKGKERSAYTAYRAAIQNPFLGPAKKRRANSDWRKAQDSLEKAERQLANLKRDKSESVKDIESLRGDIRTTRANVRRAARRFSEKRAEIAAQAGDAATSSVAIQEAATSEAAAASEAAEAQQHDARAQLLAQLTSIQDALMHFQTLQTELSGLEDAQAAEGGAPSAALQAKRSEVSAAATSVLQMILLLAQLDFSQLQQGVPRNANGVPVAEGIHHDLVEGDIQIGMAEYQGIKALLAGEPSPVPIPGVHHDIIEGDAFPLSQAQVAAFQYIVDRVSPQGTSYAMSGAFGLLPDWTRGMAYGAAYGALPSQWQTRSGQVMYRPAGMSDSAWQAALQGEGWSPAAGGGSDPSSVVNTVSNVANQAMTGIAAIIAALGNNQPPPQGAVNNLNNLPGSLPPGYQPGYQQPGYQPGYQTPPPAQAEEKTNWGPWIAASAGVLAVGTLGWALLAH